MSTERANERQCSPARAKLIHDMVDRAGWAFAASVMALIFQGVFKGGAGEAFFSLAAFAAWLFFMVSVVAAAKATDSTKSAPWLVLLLMIPIVSLFVAVGALSDAKKFARTAPHSDEEDPAEDQGAKGSATP